MWSNKEADFFPEINKSFTFPGMGLQHIQIETLRKKKNLKSGPTGPKFSSM